MPACETKEVSWTTWKVVPNTVVYSNTSRGWGPPDTPMPPQKTRNEQLKSLKEKATQAMANQSEEEKWCKGLNCQSSKVISDPPVPFPNSTVVFRWTETYETRDEDDNVVTRTANYTAFGVYTKESTDNKKKCATRVDGDLAFDKLDDLRLIEMFEMFASYIILGEPSSEEAQQLSKAKQKKGKARQKKGK